MSAPSAPRNALVQRILSSRPVNAAIVVPRRSVQQAQQKERVVDPKIGEVKPKSSHQANREDRQRMHCTHDEAKKRISLRCNPQHPVVAVVDYEIVRPGVWDLKYTQVSPEFQHHSVADEIVARTMAFAEANKCVAPRIDEFACKIADPRCSVKVIPSCSYISETFFARHPEWQRLRADTKGQEHAAEMKSDLKYSDGMHKEASSAPDPTFTTQRDANAGTDSTHGQQKDMKSSGSKGNAEKLVDREPQAQAARELNEAMKHNNERGYRGYS